VSNLDTIARANPLGAVIAAANVNDQKLLREIIEAVVADRPEPTVEEPLNLYLDAAYDNSTGREAASQANYTPHICRVREEKKLQAEALGGRTDVCLAVHVPSNPGALRQEG
jgi:hypothetical protein